jgi:putative ABC transport system permease protein
VLTAALRDLQWRKRRFVIAIVGTGLVFACTLVLTGLANGFRVEADRTVNSLGIDRFLIKAGAAGPLIGSTPFEPAPGVPDGVPIVFGSTTAPGDGSPENVNVFGLPNQRPGMPPIVDGGRAPSNVDEVAVSTTMQRPVGGDIEIGSRRMHIVGLVDDSTVLAGQANIFLTVEGAQALLFSGKPLMSSVGLRGELARVPDGYRVVDRVAAIDDLVRPLTGARQAMVTMSAFLWVVAALIVGSMIYVSALERTRDFAVFKAVGVTAGSILAGLAVQAVVVALLSALLGGVLSVVLGPAFPMRCDIPTWAFAGLPVLAVVIGLLSSIAGLRRAVAVDPALAFGGA